jgi:hypothetical protein
MSMPPTESSDQPAGANSPDSPSASPAEGHPRPGDEAAPGTPGTGENVCPQCGGQKTLNDGKQCPTCEGTGVVTQGLGGA